MTAARFVSSKQKIKWVWECVALMLIVRRAVCRRRRLSAVHTAQGPPNMASSKDTCSTLLPPKEPPKFGRLLRRSPLPANAGATRASAYHVAFICTLKERLYTRSASTPQAAIFGLLPHARHWPAYNDGRGRPSPAGVTLNRWRSDGFGDAAENLITATRRHAESPPNPNARPMP